MHLVSDRLIIRYFNINDLDDVYEYANNEKIAVAAGWMPHSSKKITRNVINGYIYNKETFAIVLKDENKVIGSVSLYSNTFRKSINAYEIGFVLNEKYWGNGYATEAVKMILEYGFKKLSALVIGVGYHVDNIRSERVVKRCGFVYEGLFRKYRRVFDGKTVDVKMYSLTNEEYKNLEEKHVR